MLRHEFLKNMGWGITMVSLPGVWQFTKAPYRTKGQSAHFGSFFQPDQVHLKKSPFKDAMDLNGKYLLELDTDRLLACFYESENLEPKAPKYGGWETSELQGHTLGHYLSGCSLMYAASGDSRYKRRVDYIVDELKYVQNHAGNGYIGGIPKGKELWKEVASGKIETENFSLNGVWSPWYNLHKTYAGLRDAYQLTENNEAKKVLIKYADWAVNWATNLNNQQFQKMLECEYGGMNEVLADVYAITGEEKYLTLAERFNHKAVFDPLANGKDELEGLHSNTQVPKIIGAAREYELNEDERLQKVASFFWQQVTQKRSYVFGGNSNDEYFGKLGSLSKRLGKATAETCNTYNMLKLTEHLMRWNPDSVYTDFYERALYNHILSSIDSKTGQVTYFVSTDPGFFKTFSTPFHSFWCCRGTGMENHAKYGSAIYMHKKDDLYVNLFIPSDLNWREKNVEIEQQTAFPLSDKTKLKISADQPQSFSLHIRRPYWVGSGFQIEVNGAPAMNQDGSAGYVAIKRKWEDGDLVTVTLPRKLHIEPMPHDPTQAAIMYGPLVLVGALGTKWMHDPEPYATDNSEYFDTPSVKVPDLKIPGSKEITDFIQPVDKKSLHFKLRSPLMDEAITLQPFYQVDHERYTVYWNV